MGAIQSVKASLFSSPKKPSASGRRMSRIAFELAKSIESGLCPACADLTGSAGAFLCAPCLERAANALPRKLLPESTRISAETIGVEVVAQRSEEAVHDSRDQPSAVCRTRSDTSVSSSSSPEKIDSLKVGDIIQAAPWGHGLTMRQGRRFSTDIVARMPPGTHMEVVAVTLGRRVAVRTGWGVGWISALSRQNDPLVERVVDDDSSDEYGLHDDSSSDEDYCYSSSDED